MKRKWGPIIEGHVVAPKNQKKAAVGKVIQKPGAASGPALDKVLKTAKRIKDPVMRKRALLGGH